MKVIEDPHERRVLDDTCRRSVDDLLHCVLLNVFLRHQMSRLHGGRWSNAFDHKSQRCVGHSGRWSGVLDHGIRLDVLHNRERFNHGCRHTHWRSRLGREWWPKLHTIHMANESSSPTLGSLGTLNRTDLQSLNDFLDDLHLKNLHNLDDWHIHNLVNVLDEWHRVFKKSVITGATYSVTGARVLRSAGAGVMYSTTGAGAAEVSVCELASVPERP